jgi:hypothetical protein
MSSADAQQSEVQSGNRSNIVPRRVGPAAALPAPTRRESEAEAEGRNRENNADHKQ